MTRKAWTGHTVRTARQRWAALLPLPCARCGQTIEPGQPFDVDHVVPLSRGGGTGWQNQSVAHPKCNRSHGTRLRNGGPRGGSVPWDIV